MTAHFTDIQIKTIMERLEEINNNAINLMEHGCYETAEDFYMINEISNLAVSVYGILFDKFKV